jgi:ectoine hydroxylase-related dioxygenase (phytanoyl-CoA dioxygenase family)
MHTQMRMWHRARPNTTDTPRPMLSLICWRDFAGTEYGPKNIEPMPEEAALRLSEHGRQLARYNIQAGEAAARKNQAAAAARL